MTFIGILGSLHLRHIFLNKHVSIPYFVVRHVRTALFTISLYSDITEKATGNIVLKNIFINSNLLVYAFAIETLPAVT